jgi:triacylglycerol esterase/lipase EstA (alpha/beta hydrolase family)
MTSRRVALQGAALLFFLCGCAGMGAFTPPNDAARNFALANGFERKIFHADRFQITTFVKRAARSKELTVYIEGDGAPWPAIDVPPLDPTPRQLTVLQLAAKDRRSPLLYLGRPCQFLENKDLRQCPAEYWSESRFASEVITALATVVTQVMRELGATRLNLMGYSGGGTIALYLAASRDDVVRLTTIASPLNHALWTEYHGISSLSGSELAFDSWAKLEKTRQFHLVGEKDKIVPPALMGKMLPPGIKAMIIRDFSHECCWVRDWEKLLAETDSLGTSNWENE